MPLLKCSLLIQFTTNPNNRQVSAAHAGGFSEQFWFNGNPIIQAAANAIASFRASMLPIESTVIGLRQQIYTVNGNKLLPGGSSVVPLNFPGSNNYTLDNPQSCLNLRLQTGGGPNVGRYCMRNLPDEVVVNGEFQPDGAFTANLNIWKNTLAGNGFGFVGRNLAALKTVVLGSDGINLLVGSTAGFNVGDYVRFLKVHAITGGTIEGSYQIIAITAPNKLQFIHNIGSDAASGGNVRSDGIGFFATSAVATQRASVRKVGRPFAGYRGRRSKQKLAS
jgi:hypothetical protein